MSATQLSESVILLSLKYIAMLLQNNPSIQGADGSEYRLFTVALMLGTKQYNVIFIDVFSNIFTLLSILQPTSFWMITPLQTRLGQKCLV